MLWGHLDVKTKMVINQHLWECNNLMKIIITQLRLLVNLPTQLWWYAPTHHPAPLQTPVQHHHHNYNEHTYHLIAIWCIYRKFWKQTITGDASLCYVITTLFYITLTLQIMSINVTYLDISASNIPNIPRHGLFCVCPQPIRACIIIQDSMYIICMFVWFSHINPVHIVWGQIWRPAVT